MHINEAQDKRRSETIGELSALLLLAQETGSRLACETHEDTYDLVQELNQLLHQSRVKLELIRKLK
ncbi:MAG: hypothetical protein PHP85_04200 [Gallionella sp.]|nr:hypothetical protein [Gallionella sp.]